MLCSAHLDSQSRYLKTTALRAKAVPSFVYSSTVSLISYGYNNNIFQQAKLEHVPKNDTIRWGVGSLLDMKATGQEGTRSAFQGYTYRTARPIPDLEAMILGEQWVVVSFYTAHGADHQDGEEPHVVSGCCKNS